MSLLDFFKEIKKRNSLLYRFGWLNVWLFVIGIVLFFTDNTLITGINAWIKPMKFAISITIYSWTFAWLLQYIPDQKKINFISVGVVMCMLIENSLIFMQAARGVRSHFNITSTFDIAVFNTMGIAILINTLFILYTIILFFQKIELETPMLWAWRAGLIFFFLGGISGGIMAATLHHTIGAPDGGPGLPFLNWSTLAGDLRSPHFITMHGLQTIPLVTFYFLKSSRGLVLLFSLAYLGLSTWLHWLAFSGMPLISI